MWIWFIRAPLPDAPYWRGRRPLAAMDAIAWPAALIAASLYLPGQGGIAGRMLIAGASVAAVLRLGRALWRNHRYRFTTWRWGRLLFLTLVMGLVLKWSQGL